MRRLLFVFSILVVLAIACGPVSTRTPTPFPTAPPPPRSVIIVVPTLTPGVFATSTARPTGGASPLPTPVITRATSPADSPTETPATVQTPTDTPSAISSPTPTQPVTGTSELPASPTAATPSLTNEPTRSATPTASPSDSSTPTPIATLPNQSLIQPSGVRVYETTISIPTYDYQRALISTDSSDPIYPYPRLEFNQVGGKAQQTYRALVLENAYVRVMVLPELGGRVYTWVDKTDDQSIAYNNPVIKPTHWGYRGWWLATGGIEWCLPTDEHGLNEYREWEASLSGTTVTVSDKEDRTGLYVQVTLSLDSTHNYLIIQPRVANNTGARQSLKFWLNAMLAFSGNKVSDATHFIMPGAQATVHSTGDSDLPDSGAAIDWPIYNGRDVSVVGNLKGWMGVFARPAASADFAGAYDTAADRGIVRVFPSSVATGVKFFAPYGIDTETWTEDGSTYFELWGGVKPTFADETTIEVGQSIGWTERWYPVNGLKVEYDYANATAALSLEDRGESVYVAAAASSNFQGAHVKLWQNNKVAAEWLASLGPGRPVSAVWQRPGGSCGEDMCRLGVQLLDETGSVLAQTGTVGQ